MSQNNIFDLVDHIKRPTKKFDTKNKSTKELLAMLFAHSARAKRAYTPKAKIRINVLGQDGKPAVRIRL